jgi:hypothetical protein
MPVPGLLVPDRLVTRLPGRDAGLNALGLESVPEPGGVVATVAE